MSKTNYTEIIDILQSKIIELKAIKEVELVASLRKQIDELGLINDELTNTILEMKNIVSDDKLKKQEYYITNIKNKIVHCDVCNLDMKGCSLSNHKKSKAHQEKCV